MKKSEKHWRHVIVKTKTKLEGVQFHVHEEYEGIGVGESPRTPHGATLDDLRHCLTRMLAATYQQVVDKTKARK